FRGDGRKAIGKSLFVEDLRHRGAIMKKGCVVACIVLLSAIAAAYLYWQSLYNPYYHGRRVRDWAEIAICDPDSAARSDAAQAVTERFTQLGAGEPRVQFLLYLCLARQNYRGRDELPKEL